MKIMKVVCYVTKKRIWAGEKEFVWDGVSFDEVIGKIKKDLKVDEMRVVLGNDVSYVTAVKTGENFLTRELVLKSVKTWMPFEIDNDCFDWKKVILGYDEAWLQIVAVEKGLLLSLSSAVKKHGIKIYLITAIGVILGNKTIGREAPVVIKWFGKESLSVLAINGLVDLAVADIKEEDLMMYACKKWGLAVNPEIITLIEGEFDLAKIVYAEKTKGEDEMILNLPMLKGMTVEKQPVEKNVVVERHMEMNEVPEKKLSAWWFFLITLAVVIGVGLAVRLLPNFW